MSAATMRQLEEATDAASICLPGGVMTATVTSASDDDLRQCLTSDLQAIASIVEPTKPTRDGLAPESWKTAARDNRSATNNLVALERIERRVTAIREELAEREKAAREARKAKQEQARRELEMVLETAPEQAAEMSKKAETVAAAAERVRALVRDLELIGGGVSIEANYDTLTSGVDTAARALGVDTPKLAGLPQGLPDRREAHRMLQMLGVGSDGFPRLVSGAGNASRAHELARKLE